MRSIAGVVTLLGLWALGATGCGGTATDEERGRSLAVSARAVRAVSADTCVAFQRGSGGDVADAKLSNRQPDKLSASYNGIALGAIDIAKQHTTRKVHSDVGLRVADYPTIQDYVGESIMDTQASRLYTFEMARRMDDVTNRCDWSIHEDDLTVMPRAQYLPGSDSRSSWPART